MLFYTVFTIKEHIQIFLRNVPKTLKMRKCHLFLANYVCMLTDFWMKYYKILVERPR